MSAAETEKKLDFGGVTERHEMVPMRDGARLSTYVYIPEGKGPWPVLYEQRYADLRGDTTRKRYARLAAHGYVIAAQNFRGTHKSEGVYQGYRALGWGKLQDGYDSVEWLAKQTWSTGKIGTLGGSQAGYAQNFLAVTRPPHLVAQYISDGGLSLFHLGYRIGGVTRGERFKIGMAGDARDKAEGMKHLADQFAHPNYDEYWQQEDCTRHFDRMDVPSYIVASWFDFMSKGSIDSYVGRQHHGGLHARNTQQLIIGPWLHGGTKNNPKIGELDLNPNSNFDQDAHILRWFDHYLKGVDNGVEKARPVRYYVMGAVGEQNAPGNEWREADDWPVPANDASYFLAANGGFGTKQSTGSTEFVSNPDDPAPSPGRGEPTARDGRKFESHKDVRTFTSEVLTKPVEWTGKVRAELFVSSSAVDTDVIVRVSDVYPDGRSILLLDGIQRASYRDSFEKRTLLTPGKVYKLAFEVGSLSQVFAPGHRIRIAISSTMFDYYEPNPGTGETPSIDGPKGKVVAKNRVYHDAKYASRIIAPTPKDVVSRRASR